MFTAARIRRHLYTQVGDKPFSIRDFLNYGTRSAVDQVFHRLVKSGELIRVARGIFIKDTAPFPSILEIAMTKAAAFGRTIVQHGSQAAYALKLSNEPSHKYIYATNGTNTSFRCGNTTVYFVRVSLRKMQLKDQPVGLAIRALWHIGKNACDIYKASMAVHPFNRHDRQMLRESIHFMPSWMNKCFTSLSLWRKKPQQKSKGTQVSAYPSDFARGTFYAN